MRGGDLLGEEFSGVNVPVAKVGYGAVAGAGFYVGLGLCGDVGVGWVAGGGCRDSNDGQTAGGILGGFVGKIWCSKAAGDGLWRHAWLIGAWGLWVWVALVGKQVFCDFVNLILQ